MALQEDWGTLVWWQWVDMEEEEVATMQAAGGGDIMAAAGEMLAAVMMGLEGEVEVPTLME